MTFDEFQNIIRQDQASHPFEYELAKDRIATDEDIRAAEQRLGVKLPEDYKLFVKAYNGGYFAYVDVLSCDPQGECYICDVYDINTPEFLKYYHFLAVSDLETGDYAGYRIENGECKPGICFYHHDEEDAISEPQYDDLFDYLINFGLAPVRNPRQRTK